MAAFVNVGTPRIIDYSFISPTDYLTMKMLGYSHHYCDSPVEYLDTRITVTLPWWCRKRCLISLMCGMVAMADQGIGDIL